MLRQETMLREVSVRLRRYLGMSQDERIKKPLLIVVPKFDVWSGMTDISLDAEPYTEAKNGRPALMDMARVDRASNALHSLFRRLCPEFVAAADGLSVAVRYIPVTALGGSPELIERKDHSFYGIRPKNIRPRWVTVPLLYCLCRWTSGTIGSKAPADKPMRTTQ